jgi:hypothetical protein
MIFTLIEGVPGMGRSRTLESRGEIERLKPKSKGRLEKGLVRCTSLAVYPTDSLDLGSAGVAIPRATRPDYSLVEVGPPRIRVGRLPLLMRWYSMGS